MTIFSHLTLPKNANPIKRNSAYDLFLFMLRADNIDYYSRQCGFIPPDRGLIRIWMQDPRYNHLIEGLENHGRSTQNIPEWSEIEMSVNGMVSAIAASLLKNAPVKMTYTGILAEQLIIGITSMVRKRLFRSSIVLVAMMAGTLQPNPIIMGMKLLPCSPMRCIILSMIKAARAI